MYLYFVSMAFVAFIYGAQLKNRAVVTLMKDREFKIVKVKLN